MARKDKTICPVCFSDDTQVVGEHYFDSPTSVYFDTKCNDCGARWREHFGLQGFTHVRRKGVKHGNKKVVR